MVVGDLASFQEDHLNHLGRPLDVDNVLGPETRWAMNLMSLSSERRTVIREAQKSLGLVEFPPGSNDDPRGIIDGWLKAARAKPGDPWCASALSAWLSTVTPVRIAGAIRLGQHFTPVVTPWAGDIFWYPTNDKGNGHVGLIIGVGTIEVMTIEGNCDNACRCVRRPRAGLRFSRPFDDTLGICPTIILSKEVPLLLGGGTR